MHRMLLLAALFVAPVHAQEPTDNGSAAGDEVVVTGRRESTLDLTRLERAQAAFAKHRPKYAPASVLYFELRPSDGVALDGFRLELRAKNKRLDVPVDASHRFTLPARMGDEWELVHNRGRTQIALRALVLSPGATEADRPLGDLRLQCRVGRSLNSNELSFKDKLIFDMLGACTSKRVVLHFYTLRPLSRATVARGSASQNLAVDWNGRRYVVPANDATLPNTARVRLTYR